MTFLKDRDRAVLREHFQNLDEPVRLIVFTDKEDCPYCEQTAQLVREVAELSGQIDVDVLDWRAESQRAADYAVDKAPAIVVLTGAGEPRDTRMRFFGVPSGYEFGTLIDDIVAASRNEPKLAPDTRDWLATLTHPLHLQVFVTPTCPYCPRAVSLAHRLALASPFVRADMVEATEFPELAQQYAVYGVPRTVINDSVAVEGAVPEGELLQALKTTVAQAHRAA